ncbi:MAG: pyridoxamine 5'-phosphate oxidase family protein [Bacillota bacterium]|nr:pyridoxamine 5'-phosphate oxidase family protein [Bacillota bacterium]
MPLLKARRTERQRTESEALDMLARASYGHLGTTTGDGYPYVVPLNHALEGTTLYVHSAPAGQKIAGIRRDGRVCFEVSEMLQLVPGEVPCRYAVAYRSAICFGRARIVEQGDEKMRALRALALKYSGKPGPIAAEDAERVCVVAIDIEAATCKARPV